ncbi:hypothetical protein DFH06DRAFT_1262238 [Mycena polygramma]|nr:hypothetical protein DFH06DRAFT_1262238 [Mycena polygramma]
MHRECRPSTVILHPRDITRTYIYHADTEQFQVPRDRDTGFCCPAKLGRAHQPEMRLSLFTSAVYLAAPVVPLISRATPCTTIASCIPCLAILHGEELDELLGSIVVSKGCVFPRLGPRCPQTAKQTDGPSGVASDVTRFYRYSMCHHPARPRSCLRLPAYVDGCRGAWKSGRRWDWVEAEV